MKKRSRITEIKEDQTIRNKIPNDRILLMAVDLGLLPEIEYETLKTIGKSRPVNEIISASTTNDTGYIMNTLQRLLRQRLIEVT